jgi:microcystin-dependent protein
MADTTISSLTNRQPNSSAVFPYSEDGTTYNASLSNILPKGLISLWYGSVVSIPTGWALCDGTNSTPDLRDRFIVGAGTTYNPNNVGGSSAVTPSGTVGNTTLTIEQIPAHNHTIGQNWRGGSSQSGGSGTFADTWAGGSPAATANLSDMFTNNAGGGGAHTHTFTGTSQTNLPPYYALAYIMKL